MINNTLEDPIYAAARKRRREWENIAHQVSNIPSKVPKIQATPYNLRKINMDATPISNRMRDGDFHEHQVALHCGLHAIHNLLREDSWPTVKEMNEIAIECAKESGDKIYNHKSMGGYWSIDTILRALLEKEYLVDCMIDTKNNNGKDIYLWKHNLGTMYSLLENDKVLGFIIHQPQHYTALRKTIDKKHWQYSNSYNKEAISMDPHDFCKQALDGYWNIYLVRKK